MGTSYDQLSAEERAMMMLMRGEGCSLRAMARKLHRAPSTISRELARNAGEAGSYDARLAGILLLLAGERRNLCVEISNLSPLR